MRASRGFLITVSIADGLAGLICGVLFIAGPDGRLMQAGALLPVIRTLPLAGVFFRDFTWIGIAMLLALGIPNALSTVLLLRKDARQYIATLIAGALLILWCGFELLFMFNGLAVGYLAVGVISVACSAWLLSAGRASTA